jgi:hypothetical protein
MLAHDSGRVTGKPEVMLAGKKWIIAVITRLPAKSRFDAIYALLE